jgi:hypothetical protein
MVTAICAARTPRLPRPDPPIRGRRHAAVKKPSMRYATRDCFCRGRALDAVVHLQYTLTPGDPWRADVGRPGSQTHSAGSDPEFSGGRCGGCRFRPTLATEFVTKQCRFFDCCPRHVGGQKVLKQLLFHAGLGRDRQILKKPSTALFCHWLTACREQNTCSE